MAIALKGEKIMFTLMQSGEIQQIHLYTNLPSLLWLPELSILHLSILHSLSTVEAITYNSRYTHHYEILEFCSFPSVKVSIAIYMLDIII